MLRRPIAFPLLLLSFACRAPDPVPEPPELATTAPGEAAVAGEPSVPPPVDEAEAAIAAIRDGRYAEARDILGGLLFVEYLAEARAQLDAGNPEDGLLYVDRALQLQPRDADARLVDAQGRLMLAEKGMLTGGSALFIQGSLEDAFAGFKRSGTSAEASFGASRAARLLGRNEEALLHAKNGFEALGNRTTDLDPSPNRIYAEAAYGAYVERKTSGEADPDDLHALFLETEQALHALFGREANDPWVHTTLAYLYEWEERYVDAQGALERGLDRLPDDEGMLERLASVARQAGGPEHSLATFEKFTARHPDVALGYWYEAYERFHVALAAFENGDRRPAEFRSSEASFRRCREIQTSYGPNCKGYEVMCRNAVGWCLYNDGDIDGARDAFLSMEDVFERGMEWQIDGRLQSGVSGLAWCADAYNKEEDFLAAAETFDLLRTYRPEDIAFHNNAGFFFRDVAVETEFLGQRLCAAARGEITSADRLQEMRASIGLDDAVPAGSEAEREAFRRAADETMALAREQMEKSRDAYMDASAGAPEDVRVVNDTALVLIYYLHEDLELAEEYLRRCVEMGAEQILNPELEEDAKAELRTAWGDAYQNLGVLYAHFKNDKDQAMAWFEKSVEVDPDVRETVKQYWLPYLRGELDVKSHEELFATLTWADPCE